jgi:hypothetical protein
MSTPENWQGVHPEIEMACADPDDASVSPWSWLAAALYLGIAMFIIVTVWAHAPEVFP